MPRDAGTAPHVRTTDINDHVHFPKPQTAAEAVDNGIRLLDARAPGWRDRVDPRTLRIESTDGCILGQVFREDARAHGDQDASGYGVGCRRLGLSQSRRSPGEFGFSGLNSLVTLAGLQEEWMKRLP